MTPIHFNVIVPTRERASTLFHCLRTLVAQEYEHLTILVSDNLSQDNTKEVVASFSDKRIRYVNTGSRISMSHNWEFALDHVKDGWVTFLGDDDGMLPGGLARVAQVIAESNCTAIASKSCHYTWPEANGLEHQLRIPITRGVQIRDGHTWLKRVMQGSADYTDLPCIYTGGFADMALINAARHVTGPFFMSMIPDVYSGVALAAVCNRFAMLNEPICVAGLSAQSNGASQLGFGGGDRIVQKFFSESNIPFHAVLGSGQIKSLQILVYECYLQAAHLHKDALKVQLEDQLAFAISVAMPNRRKEVMDYCQEVAHRNAVSFDVIEKKRRLRRLHDWVRRFANVGKHWKQIIVDARDFSVHDVYGAAVLASAIAGFRQRYGNWRWRNLKYLFMWAGFYRS